MRVKVKEVPLAEVDVIKKPTTRKRRSVNPNQCASWSTYGYGRQYVGFISLWNKRRCALYLTPLSFQHDLVSTFIDSNYKGEIARFPTRFGLSQWLPTGLNEP